MCWAKMKWNSNDSLKYCEGNAKTGVSKRAQLFEIRKTSDTEDLIRE